MAITKEGTLINSAFKAMLDNTTDMVFVKDAKLVYRAASMPFARMVGKTSVEEIVGHTDSEIFEDKNLAKRYVEDDKKLMKSGRDLVDYLEPITEEGGKARYGSTSKHLLLGKNNEVIGILGITKDVTRDYVIRQHYQKELRYLFELPKDTYAVTYLDITEWRIISQRKQLIADTTIQSCISIEELVAAAIEAIEDKDSDVVKFYRNFKPAILKSVYSNGISDLSFKYQRRMLDGTLRWIHNSIKFMMDIDTGHLCAMLTAKDIEEEKRIEKNLIESAKMDKMTKVLNREYTMESINRVLKEEADSSHVLFMIDVDNFKLLNDTLGHQKGDEFLIEFAAEIQNRFRKNDIVGRIGGDEFFALMRNVSGIPEAKEKAKELMADIQEVCADYSVAQLSGSIGVSVYPNDGTTLQELYAKADNALYDAKRKGKSKIIFASI